MALVFDVTAFGAIANDGKDDTKAIQDAIDAAYKAGGGIVKIPAGTFIVSGDKTNPSVGAVEVRSGVTLDGAGMGETILKLADNFNERINGIVRTPVDESVTDVVISNLTIDGNRAANTGHQAAFICGVKENNDGILQQNITLDKVEAMNCTSYGIDPHEFTYNLTVQNCVAHDNGTDGFVADAVIGGVFRNNVSYDNDRHGFNVTTSSSNVTLENNVAYDNKATGVVVQRGDIFPDGQTDIEWPNKILITGNEIRNNGTQGVLLLMGDQVTVAGNKVFGNGQQGVRVEGSTASKIIGNEIHDNAQAGTATVAYDEVNIRLRIDDAVNPPRTFYSLDTIVSGNTIYSSGPISARYGVREETSNSTAEHPSGTAVSDNAITGAGTGSYSIPAFSATQGDDFLPGTLAADKFAGLGGNDVYLVNNSADTVTEAANAGIDTVISSLNFTLGANIENLFLTGTGIRATGNALDNTLVGNAAANELEGLEGKDTLDGGAGADKMSGGDGDDIYFVDNAGDTIVEKDHAGLGGVDTVYASVSYTLSPEVETLVLQGTGNLAATGNIGNNTLVGNSGNNVLDGAGGADTMKGGAGNDTYYVDHTGDVVTELVGEGVDTVYSALTYTLGDNVENLVLLGLDPKDGNGNALANAITGSAGANRLHGYGGNDVIDGGKGADQLYGDDGNDTFVMRKGEFQGDVIEDFDGKGAADGDRIAFLGFGSGAKVAQNLDGSWTVTDGTYTESFRVKLAPGGTAPVLSDFTFDGVAPTPTNQAPVAAGSGNAIAGNEDTAIAGRVPAASDPDGDTALVYSLLKPVDGLVFNRDGTFTFQPAANSNGPVVFSYDVADAAGAHSAAQSFTIEVRPVNDAPVAASAGNGVVGDEDTTIRGKVPAASDVDGDTAFVYRLMSQVDGLVFNADGTFAYRPPADFNGTIGFSYDVADASGAHSAAQDFAIDVRAVNDAPVAASAGNTVSGNEDTTIAGKVPVGTDVENDALTYGLVDPVNGLAFKADGSFTYVPAKDFFGEVSFQYRVLDDKGAASAPQVFKITVLPVDEPPAAGLVVNGTKSADKLYGGDGNDIIDGKAGKDMMYGGAGDDVYYVDSSGDKVFEAVGGGTADRIYTTASFTLASDSYVEQLIAQGSAKISLTGNGAANTLLGNAAANTLSGNAGNDILNGGLGADTLKGGAGADRFVFDTALGAGNVDAIKDFDVKGGDLVVLNGDIFGALPDGALSAAAFRVGTQALDADDRIVYDKQAGKLFYDADGAGGQAGVLFATISTKLALAADDFVVTHDLMV